MEDYRPKKDISKPITIIVVILLAVMVLAAGTVFCGGIFLIGGNSTYLEPPPAVAPADNLSAEPISSDAAHPEAGGQADGH